MKSKSILRNMLISYGVIILLYIGAWSVMQMKAVSILKEQTEIIYSDLLTVLSGVVDNEILDIKKVSLDIAMDPVNVSLMDFAGERHIMRKRPGRSARSFIMSRQMPGVLIRFSCT